MNKTLLIILFEIAYCGYLNAKANNLDLKVINGNHLPVDKKYFLLLANEIYQYECDRINYNENLSITIEARTLEGDVRGQVLADSNKLIIYLATDSIKTISKLMGIFAHELGHVIYFKWINSLQGTNNKYWDEGFACWIAGKYYLQWQGFKDYYIALKQIISSKKYYDIKNIYSEKNRPALQRDVIYIEWTSFINFLIEKHGLEKTLTLSNLFIEAGKGSNYLSESKSFKSKTDENAISELIDRTKVELKKRNKEIEMKIKEAFTKVYDISFDELIKQWLLTNTT